MNNSEEKTYEQEIFLSRIIPYLSLGRQWTWNFVIGTGPILQFKTVDKPKIHINSTKLRLETGPENYLVEPSIVKNSLEIQLRVIYRLLKCLKAGPCKSPVKHLPERFYETKDSKKQRYTNSCFFQRTPWKHAKALMRQFFCMTMRAYENMCIAEEDCLVPVLPLVEFDNDSIFTIHNLADNIPIGIVRVKRERELVDYYSYSYQIEFLNGEWNIFCLNDSENNGNILRLTPEQSSEVLQYAEHSYNFIKRTTQCKDKYIYAPIQIS